MVLLYLLFLSWTAWAIVREMDRRKEPLPVSPEKCPGCRTLIEPGGLLCPHCRQLLRRACHACGSPTGTYHSYCPWCGSINGEDD